MSKGKIAAFCAVALTAGCVITEPGNGRTPGIPAETGLIPQSALDLQLFAGCDELRDYMAEAWYRQYIESSYYDGRGILEADLAFSEDAAATSGAADDGNSLPDDVSTTNIQEAGVDEADIVKTLPDGTIAIVNGGYLSIIDAFPPDAMTETSRLELDGTPGEMYYSDNGKRIVVLGQDYAYAYSVEPGYDGPDSAGSQSSLELPGVDLDHGFSGVRAHFVDATDPAVPGVDREIVIEGWLLSSRRVGNRVHIVSRFEQYLPHALDNDQEFWNLVDDLYGSGRRRATAAARLRSLIQDRIQQIPDAELVPRTFIRTGDDFEPANIVGCQNVMRPGVTMSPGMVVVTSVDVDGANPQATAVQNNAWLTYASQDNLYVSQSSGGWWWDGDQPSETVIYRFEVSDQRPVYQGWGRVPGWVDNQFSFSERDDVLRVATTDWDEASNGVYTLAVEPGQLPNLGHLDGLAPGESIFSARFVGDIGYLVTFRQVDPLFAIDLSNPEAPKLLGELKIPGFSTYIHPIGEDYLLTVGRDGDDEGVIGGVSLQLFDVRDPADPKLLHKHVPDVGYSGWTWSPAEYDHRAFTFYEPRGILAVPLTVADWERDQYFSGIATFHVDPATGITETGRVDHSELTWQSYCADPSESWIAEECEYGAYVWAASPTRSVIMTSGGASYLYSVSRIGVKATPVDNSDLVLGTVALPTTGYGWWWY